MLLLVIIVTSIYCYTCLIIYNTNAEYMFIANQNGILIGLHLRIGRYSLPSFFAHNSSLRADNFVLDIKLCHNLTSLKNQNCLSKQHLSSGVSNPSIEDILIKTELHPHLILTYITHTIFLMGVSFGWTQCVYHKLGVYLPVSIYRGRIPSLI